MARRIFPLVLLLTATIVASSCSTALLKIKPAVELPPLPENSRNTDAGGCTVRVAPLLNDDESQEMFEANLPLSGVLPLRVELVYQNGLPIELKRARFRLRDSQGREWKYLPPKKALSRILKANEVTLYNPHARKQSEADISAYALDLSQTLSQDNPRRSGYLFFQTPDKRPVQSGQQLTLTIERLPQTATIAIN
jgi:hypothetical protein